MDVSISLKKGLQMFFFQILTFELQLLNLLNWFFFFIFFWFTHWHKHLNPAFIVFDWWILRVLLSCLFKTGLYEDPKSFQQRWGLHSHVRVWTWHLKPNQKMTQGKSTAGDHPLGSLTILSKSVFEAVTGSMVERICEG